jgi:ABC-type multidrug transport system permease subunit
MAVGKKEQSRKLTEAEQRRIDRCDQISAELAAQGYRRVDLTTGIVRANIFTAVVSVPVFAALFVVFMLVNDADKVDFSSIGHPIAIVAVLVLVVVHELIHGLTWSRFTPRGMADIEFGFMKEFLTPYCACTAPLPKTGYIVGTLAPMVVLGIIPTIVSIAIGSFGLWFVGVIMTLAGGGDLLIVILLLRHKSAAAEQLIYDHPTQAGCIVFER